MTNSHFSCSAGSEDLNSLADRIADIKPGWLPIVGHIRNVTFTLDEADRVIDALRHSASALSSDGGVESRHAPSTALTGRSSSPEISGSKGFAPLCSVPKAKADGVAPVPSDHIPDAAQSVSMREALVKSGCTSPDGTYVHASMDDVLRAAQPPAVPVEKPKGCDPCNYPQCGCQTSPPCPRYAHAPPSPERSSAETDDVRWAVNYLLEQIAAKFEAWDTLDLFRSDAAATVRRFKHDLSSTSPQPTLETDSPLAKCEECGTGPCESCMNSGYKHPDRAELALAADELAKLPGDVYWLLAKGRTRPDEPLWGVGITNKAGDAIAEAEGDHPADVVRAAASQISRSAS